MELEMVLVVYGDSPKEKEDVTIHPHDSMPDMILSHPSVPSLNLLTDAQCWPPATFQQCPTPQKASSQTLFLTQSR